MPKITPLNEYKWAVQAMLTGAKLPYIGSPGKLKYRGVTLDDGTVVVHINLPWILEGEDRFDISPHENGKWGWQVATFQCKGQVLTMFDTFETLNVADPESNKRLTTIVAEGIEKARVRQLIYAKRRV